jgi:hypothetical protein
MTNRGPIPLALLAATLIALASGAAAQPRPEDAPAVYVVKAGDTLYDLAEHYLIGPTSAREVGRLNRIADPRRIPVGRTLSIPSRLLRTEPVIARLAAYSGAVTVEGPGAGPVRQGMAIGEGYVLATGANAFLTFELPDGSRTTLPSHSRVRVLRLRRVLLDGALQRDLRLEEGRSNSVVTPMSGPRSRFRIETPVAVSAVRGTEFRVKHDPERARSTLEVVEGQVEAAAGEGAALVAAGFGVAATAAGPTEPKPLLPRPSLLRPGRLQDDEAVAFELQTTPGAVAYHVQIAADAGFIDVTAEARSDTPRLTLADVPNGAHFARFTAIDGEGLEGLPATYAFERRLNAVGLERPAAMDGGRRYLFRWRSTGGAPETFRFVLARGAEDGTPVIDEAGLPDPQIVVTDLPPGVYYWRVVVARREDGRVLENWSPPERFEIGG